MSNGVYPAVSWKKATASQSENCVEVCLDLEAVLVRDSKDITGPTLTFTRAEWAAFLTGARAGEFD